MKWLNGHRMGIVLVGFLASIVLSGSNAKADFVFGEPTNLGPIINSSSHDEGPYITPDGLSLYYSSTRTGGHGDYDLWLSKRSTVDDDWAYPINLGSKVNSSAGEYDPYISSDGLQLYFYSNRSGGYGSYDLWVATRQNVQDEWDTPKNIGHIVNGSKGENDPVISADGLELYFDSNRSGGHGSWDIYVATRQTIDSEWQNPVNLGQTVNSSANDTPGSISADGLTLFLYSTRSGGYGGWDIWVTRRETKNSPWEEPVNLGPTVNGSTDDAFPRISFNGCWLYFSDFYAPYRPGGLCGEDMWKAPIIPIVDLNADGIIDAADMCIMVDNWGTDNSLCDIGPTPFGDGVVDVEDLIVLAEHLFEEFPPADAEPVE
jgi:Tol biopolymer transport system component